MVDDLHWSTTQPAFDFVPRSTGRGILIEFLVPAPSLFISIIMVGESSWNRGEEFDNLPLACSFPSSLIEAVLSPQQIGEFRRCGHLTVPELFSEEEVAAAQDDLATWSEEFLKTLPAEQRAWYLEAQGVAGDQSALRKLDHPVFHRPVFARLAKHPALLEAVQQLIGGPLSVFFSQVFMKPPGVGGPKPIHQDNFYFGPDDPDATLTVWIALDEATIENGCLFYHDGPHHELIPHEAPPDEPFNLQIPASLASQFAMSPAPVPRGGVSFHHGNTPHQSSANRSARPRRAAAFHYIRDDARLLTPALEFDDKLIVMVS